MNLTILGQVAKLNYVYYFFPAVGKVFQIAYVNDLRVILGNAVLCNLIPQF